MTSMSSLAPVAPIASASAVATRAGSASALQAAQPSLALEAAFAGNSFAGLLAASGRQAAPSPTPAPAAPSAPAPTAGKPVPPQPAPHPVEQAKPRASDHLQPTAAAAQARPAPAKQQSDDADDAGDKQAGTTASVPDDDRADVAETTEDRSTPSHRARKSAVPASTDAFGQTAALAAATQTAPSAASAAAIATPNTSHGVDAATASTAADDGTTSPTGDRVTDRRASHGVIGADATQGAAGGATAAIASDARSAAAAAQADPRATLATAVAEVVAAAVQASGNASAPTTATASAADTRDIGNVGAAGAASAASAVDMRSAAASVDAPTSVVVATPTDAPDFREALGAQVSVLVKDGVQTAELHLNPADMGPISVHIAMDGAQAKIDFGADSADTRKLIETGLPELASALRDAGFTLSGGGVSDHRQGRSNGDAEAGGNDTVRRVDVTDDTSSTRRTVSAASVRRTGSGGLDLYA